MLETAGKLAPEAKPLVVNLLFQAFFVYSRVTCYIAMTDATYQSIENARLDYYANRLCVISDSKELDHLGLTSKSTPHVPVFSAEELNVQTYRLTSERSLNL